MSTLPILVFLVTFSFMEFVAWFTHKHVMHGFLWKLHRDHHTRDNKGPFEKNDSFFLIFATPSSIFIFLGSYLGLPILLAVGFGIAAYGLCYFLVHDVLIHQRIKWFRRNDNFYFRAIRKAHKVHHKKLDRHDGQCFGMLVVPLKYFRED
ncbi:MAG: sterol desaturase family protein [Vicingaceae bacterium]